MRHHKAAGTEGFGTIYTVEFGRYRGRVVWAHQPNDGRAGLAHVKLDGYDKTLIVCSTQNYPTLYDHAFSLLKEGQQLSLEIVTRNPRTLGVDLFRGVRLRILPGVKS